MLYAYILLCIGCCASDMGAPALFILIIATLLALPSITWVRGQSVLAVEIVVHSINALIFASLAHVVGRGVAMIWGT